MKRIIIIFVAALLFFAACTPAEKEAVENELTNKDEQSEVKSEEKATDTPTEAPTDTPTPEPMPLQVAIVVALDGYAAPEFHPVMDAIINAGYEPIVVSSELGTADGRVETMEVNHAIGELNASDLRGIVLIGGSDSLWENAELHALLAACRDNGRLTAAICLASVTLAKAGVIGEGDTACWFNCDIADPEMEAAGVLGFRSAGKC